MKAYANLSYFIDLQKTKESQDVKKIVGLKGWVIYINLLSYLKKHKEIEIDSDAYYQFQQDTCFLTDAESYEVYNIVVKLVRLGIFQLNGSLISHKNLTLYMDNVSNIRSRAAYSRWNKDLV